MNYKRIYEYRFKNVNPHKKEDVWYILSNWIYKNYLNSPERILDPAAGMCEFINSVPSKEKWVIDSEEEFIKKYANNEVKTIVGSSLITEIPHNYFNGIFISNFLEHLKSQDEVAHLLTKMYESLAINGRIVIMGPNFKYCYDEYFDFADHNVILSDISTAEHLFGAGFDIIEIFPRFFPLSFRSGSLLPANSMTVKAYLHFRIAWKFFGKQFLVVAEKRKYN